MERVGARDRRGRVAHERGDPTADVVVPTRRRGEATRDPRATEGWTTRTAPAHATICTGAGSGGERDGRCGGPLERPHGGRAPARRRPDDRARPGRGHEPPPPAAVRRPRVHRGLVHARRGRRRRPGRRVPRRPEGSAHPPGQRRRQLPQRARLPGGGVPAPHAPARQRARAPGRVQPGAGPVRPGAPADPGRARDPVLLDQRPGGDRRGRRGRERAGVFRPGPGRARVIDTSDRREDAQVTRLEAIRRMLPLLGGAAVISNLGRNTYDLYAAGDRPQNFYMWGAMGCAVSVGLGLALARPALRVVVLDGDGSLLMNLGALATVAACRPPNLVEVLFDNGAYETTGGQPTHTTRGADLAAIARGAGIERVATASDLEGFARAIERALRDEGPWFVLARVEQATSFARAPRRPISVRDRFIDAIGPA